MEFPRITTIDETAVVVELSVSYIQGVSDEWSEREIGISRIYIRKMKNNENGFRKRFFERFYVTKGSALVPKNWSTTVKTKILNWVFLFLLIQ